LIILLINEKNNNLSISEKNKISLNAIEIAKNLTDFKAAKKYLDTVISI
jgi:hypothetical protein